MTVERQIVGLAATVVHRMGWARLLLAVLLGDRRC